MKTITHDVLACQAARDGLDRLVGEVTELVYRYPAGRAGLTEEDGAEFLLRFYPRISRLLKRYRDDGTPFEGYLQATLRWQLRSFVAERTTDRIRFVVSTDRNTAPEVLGHELATVDDARTSDGLIREPAGTGGHRRDLRDRRDHQTRRTAPANRPSALRLAPGGPQRVRLTPGEAQRLLCLALKSREAFAEDTHERLAAMVGCDPGWLEERYHELRSSGEALRQKRETLRVRRDQAWFRMRCIETQLLEALPSDRQRLREERDRWHRRFERNRLALRRTPGGPTHAQIASVLGIAKGTVDSSIFKARQELRDPEYRARLARLLERT